MTRANPNLTTLLFFNARGLSSKHSIVIGMLRQHGVAFTVDSGVDGPLITGIGRKSTTDGRVTQSSEQQIEFDARRRLRAMRTGATLQSR